MSHILHVLHPTTKGGSFHTPEVLLSKFSGRTYVFSNAYCNHITNSQLQRLRETY